jgi:hypothetical protein
VPDDIYIVHMANDDHPVGTICGASWPETPPLDPDLVIPPEGIRVDPPAHYQPDQIRQCEDCRRILLGRT